MPEILQKVIEIQNPLYQQCGFQIEKFEPELESTEYYAHTALINKNTVKFRIAKKTPLKTGWFVTMWKRENKITQPYDQSDCVDFFVITIVDQERIGQFVFPKNVLIEKKIFSKNHHGGKRGIRVYSIWDKVTNPIAMKTQKWQCEYFVELSLNQPTKRMIQTLKWIFQGLN